MGSSPYSPARTWRTSRSSRRADRPIPADPGASSSDIFCETPGGGRALALAKPANTLSFNLAASALGVPLPIVAHLTGTSLGGNLVQFTFDESYAGGGLLLVDGVHLTHATGTITTAVSYVPGATGPLCNGAACLGDVLLDVIPPMSSIHVQGDFGDTFITINHAQLIGGVTVPRLKSFYYAGDPVCSKPSPTTALLTVRLAGPSPSPGTQVVLHSAFPAGVSVPLLQSVLAGHDSTTVTATIAPSFFGIVHIAAAAGGAVGFVDLEAGRGLIDIPVRGAVATTATSLNDNGAALGFYTNTAGALRGFRYAGGSNAADLPLIGTAPVLPIAENDAGQILGTATSSTGVVTSVVVSPTGAVARLPPPTGYTTFVARSINRAGRVVGTATTTAGLPRALMWNPTTGFLALTDYIPGLVATDALHINDADDIVVQGTLNGRTDLYLVSL